MENDLVKINKMFHNVFVAALSFHKEICHLSLSLLKESASMCNNPIEMIKQCDDFKLTTAEEQCFNSNCYPRGLANSTFWLLHLLICHCNTLISQVGAKQIKIL